MKSGTPITMRLKVGPRTPATEISRRHATKTDVEIALRISEGGARDIIAYVEDPNGNIVAGSLTDRHQVNARLSYQTFIPGDYTIVLDNSFSAFSSKVVELTVAGL